MHSKQKVEEILHTSLVRSVVLSPSLEAAYLLCSTEQNLFILLLVFAKVR